MNILSLVLAVLAVIWSAVFAYRGSLVGSCILYLIAACCLSGELWSVDAAGLTWSLDRLLLLLILIAFAVQWRLGRTDPKPRTGGDTLLAGFLVLLLFSTFTHDWRASGPDAESVLVHLINGYMIPVVIFLVAKHARLAAKDLRIAYRLLAALGVYLAVTALLEVSGQWTLVFPRYIADETVGIHFGRARGPMLQSARLGLYLVVCGAATVALVAQSDRPGRVPMLLLAVLAPCYLAAIYFTYTRSVWLGAGLAALVAAGTTLPRRWRLPLFASAIAIGVTVVAVIGDKLIAFERETSAAVTRRSTYMRASIAYVSWKMFQDRPVTGFGFGQFPEHSKFYLSDRTTTLQLEHIRGYIHHNTFLSLLVELGIFGLALFLALLGHWIWTGWSLWRDSSRPRWVRVHGLLFLVASAPYFFQLMFREVSYSPIENALVFFLAGTCASLRAQDCRRTHPASSWWPEGQPQRARRTQSDLGIRL